MDGHNNSAGGATAINLTEFRSLNTKANFAIGFLLLSGVYWLVEVYVALALLGDPLSLSHQALDTIISIEEAYPLLAIATAVAFVVWSFGAHQNLKWLGRTNIRHQDQATIWWWIVPFVFLFMPFRVVYETVRGSAAPIGDPDWRSHRLDRSAIWWTVLFLGGLLMTQVSGQMSEQAITESELEAAVTTLLVGSLVMIGAAIAAGVMMNRVTVFQFARTSQLTSQPATLPQAVTTQDAMGRHQEQPAFCSACGTSFDEDDRFCRSCGAPRHA